jgi:hypothetical protein
METAAAAMETAAAAMATAAAAAQELLIVRCCRRPLVRLLRCRAPLTLRSRQQQQQQQQLPTQTMQQLR